ncbi:MAG: hypothetical protein QOH81_1654 [Sphingomonadales bacterium]|jgi:hypothetical protein|nr:hypothetical protein [Sphingomonadales bacterium]
MSVTDERLYHQDRARAELDWAYRAEGRAAATAHLLLSSLHMRRLDALRTSATEDEAGEGGQEAGGPDLVRAG